MTQEQFEVRKQRAERDDQEKQKENKKLSERRAEAQEKFKSGKKLTTEDLILLQGMDE